MFAVLGSMTPGESTGAAAGSGSGRAADRAASNWKSTGRREALRSGGL
jgi:hypothetical protein